MPTNAPKQPASLIDHLTADAIRRVADAITPSNTLPGHDASGGMVMSLTEAVMGVTAGLYEVASAMSEIAAAIRRHTDRQE